MKTVQRLVKTALFIPWAMLLGAAIGGGALADDSSPGAEQKDWSKIVVPADPLLVRSVPSPAQLAYQNNQLGAFLHYGPAVFMNGDYLATPDPKVFNPPQLDAEQWVRVAKSFGARHLVLSTKHHNGFCLWPTKTTDYSVRSSPWRNGQGDLVREVADACRKYGLGLGLYYSGTDKHFPCTTLDPPTVTNRDAYWPVYRQQIEELLSNYGDIVCLWLDGYGDPFVSFDDDPRTGKPYGEAVDPKTGKLYGDEIVAMVKAKQPNIVIYGGCKPDSHSFDNESGRAPYPFWNVLHKGEGWGYYCIETHSAEGWILGEAINCEGTFHWTHTLPPKLMEEYYMTIGRGANFLNALVPDARGLIDDAQAKAQAEFGAELQRRFGHPIARTDSSTGWLEPGVIELDLGGPKKIAHVILEEEIAKGQHVLKYAVDAAAGGTWKTVAEGESIGRKRIERFQPAITAEKIRLRITQANAIPSISALAAYDIE
jgi:alpha-L-fucosidase